MVAEAPPPSGMLDEPSLSRQWVLRRLQRAYMVDRWGGAYRRGLVRSAPEGLAEEIRPHAEAAERRAATVRAAIEWMGSAPYGSLGVLRGICGLGGRLLGRFGRPVAFWILVRVSRFTLGEYDALVGLSDRAPGVPEGLAGRLRPLLAASRREFEWIRRKRE